MGNREAELVALRPKPPVVQEPEPTGVSEELTNVVLQLSQENARLASKVSTQWVIVIIDHDGLCCNGVRACLLTPTFYNVRPRIWLSVHGTRYKQ